ncbi:DUF3307 domain-containing protein [Sulfuriroseicoccus oceanibius]|uniref:DUF3307 domain-containing protein n=1 Tax=Sulfuriroseicoccus oceanibius TaxID=2707525 RepID=A0A7T7JCD3_9BACT|nr:DUF3307 domain-containing protein [Sulfuriroseicoccus oceanibius]QQL44891.1 DUF3307 domain-containing protein [Sulfuriroseicoccus oceanibius]
MMDPLIMLASPTLSLDAFGSVAGALTLFFALLIGHALGDFPLQGEFLATGKNRHLVTEKGGDLVGGGWFVCLIAHALIHAGLVWALTGSVVLGCTELVLHAVIDAIRCEGKLGFVADQLLHVACKGGFAVLLFFGLVA